MTVVDLPYRRLRHHTAKASAIRAHTAAAGAVVIGAVMFNALLAVVNGHLVPINATVVMVAEGLILGAAVALVAAGSRPAMTPWMVVAGILVCFAVVRSAALGEVSLKYARDVLIVPVFIMLGLTIASEQIHRIVFAVHIAVCGVFVLELMSLDLYANVFKIPDYYIATRGTRIEQFYDPSSALFINATRPAERFFSFVEAPRMSSVFLEPVSLGNYCAIMTGYAVAVGRSIGVWRLAFLALSIPALIVGCDGRLAVVTSLAILFTRPVTRHVPAGLSVVILPATLAGALLAVSLDGWASHGDNFTGRVASSMHLLGRLDLVDWLGLSDRLLQPSVDSGIVYLVITQSAAGVGLLWCAVTLLAKDQLGPGRIFIHAAAIFISLTLLVSYSLVTIKTAALLWAVYGAFLGGNALRRSE